MDFDRIRNINIENLKRADLGFRHQDIFNEIYQTFVQLRELILGFDNIYNKLLPSEQEKLLNISNSVMEYIEKINNFTVLGGETVRQGIEKSKILLDEVRTFYSKVLPVISQLQTYFKDELKKKIDELTKNFQRQFDEAIGLLEGQVSIKIADIDQKNKNRQVEINNLIQGTQTLINNKINELNTVSNRQQEEIKDFVELNKTKLYERFSEIDKNVSRVGDVVKEVEEVKDNVEKLNESTQNFSLVSVVSKYGEIFKEQAKKNYRLSRYFGVAFLVLVAGSIYIVIHWFLPLVEEFNQPLTPIKGVEYFAFAFAVRLTVIFFICWVIKELLRNSNSNSHMYNLNTHRSNSLKSFEIIVRNNVLPENRDDIVKQVAQTIFANQDDGFLPQDKKDIPFNDVINLINTIKK